MINLYTSSTPNGHKASVTLEELGLPYETFAMELGNEDQKKDWYLNICPNGRIPAIVDKEENCFPMIQSGSAHNEMVLNKNQKQDAKSAEKGKILV